MFINFNNFKKSNLGAEQLMFLLAVNQEDLDYIIEHFDLVEDLDDFVIFIKGKKSQTDYEKIRLSKLGKQFFKALGEVIVDDEDIVVFNFMKKSYLSMDKEVGNGAKTKRYINWFKNATGIRKNRLISLLSHFLFDENNMEYNHKLEYAFYKPATMYEVKPRLEESRLYKYYEANEEDFLKMWESNPEKYEI